MVRRDEVALKFAVALLGNPHDATVNLRDEELIAAAYVLADIFLDTAAEYVPDGWDA